MLQRLWSWLERVPLSDPAERRTAATIQVFIAVGQAWIWISLVLGVRQGMLATHSADLALITMAGVALLASAGLLRAGHYRAGLWWVVAGTFFPIAGLIAPGLVRGSLRIPLLFIPLTAASLLLGRRALLVVLAGALATLGIASLRDAGHLGGPGALVPAPVPVGVFVQAGFALACVAIVVESFGGLLRDTLARSLRREADLAASEERFRLAFTTSPDAMNIVRMTDGIYVEVNDAFTRLLGWPREEMVGRTSTERELWVDRAQRAALLERLARGEPVYNVEAAFRRKDGEVSVGLISARTVVLDGVPHLLAAVRDMTERRREEQERQALLERLHHAQKLEAIGRLTGGVAHDFNNVLTSILSSAQLLREAIPANDPAHADVEQIESDARRAAELTRQLLAIARKHEDAPQVIRIEERARSLEKLLRRVMGASIAVSTRLPDGGWPVFVDPGQVEQVILNLAVNARDAMQSGGTLTISTENVTIAEPRRAGDPPPGEYVLLVVADTGVGMDADTRARAFEPFFTTKGEHGTGLGLANCAEIVRKAGGTIALESAVGAGTTFRIFLPRAAARGGAADAPRAVALHGDETILVVEDDPTVRRLAVRALGQLGYEVLDAASASEALAKASRHPGPVHGMVVDLELPDGSGREAAAWIQGARGPVPTLLVSGSPDVLDHERDRPGPRLEVLAKPYTPVDLARRVRLLLDGAAAAVTPDPTRSGSRTA